MDHYQATEQCCQHPPYYCYIKPGQFLHATTHANFPLDAESHAPRSGNTPPQQDYTEPSEVTSHSLVLGDTRNLEEGFLYIFTPCAWESGVNPRRALEEEQIHSILLQCIKSECDMDEYKTIALPLLEFCFQDI